MSTSRFLFTSESVTEGHPDKVCDQISDAILDAFLKQDPTARVAAETSVTTGLVLVTGEVTSKCYVDINAVVRKTIEEIGYVGERSGGFDGRTCGVLVSIDEQSADIAAGVDEAHEVRSNESEDAELDKIGAGDQGIMFGFACNETPDLMPLPIHVAHGLVRQLADVRKNETMKYLRPDGKSQVTVEYIDGKPSRIDTVVISTQHDPEIEGIADNDKVQARITEDMKKHVIDPVFADLSVKPDSSTKYFINPSGRFVVGGPQGDAGLTGRKIIVDTYGGYSRHGGGAFSGKDPTKVDRSAAYALRYVAKNLVAAGIADKCEVQVGYAIGVAKPVSVNVHTFGTGKISDDDIAELVLAHFDLRPAAIIKHFDLQGKPGKENGIFYRKVAAYGHMGRPDLNLPWEALDKVDALKQALNGLQAEKKSETTPAKAPVSV
ncbi:MAG: methionine adenosyltransferase [Vampirovibrio sp.]|nr:methionine adenosyltransferase [Vampirovibrio sp.]